LRINLASFRFQLSASLAVVLGAQISPIRARGSRLGHGGHSSQNRLSPSGRIEVRSITSFDMVVASQRSEDSPISALPISALQ